MKTLISILFIFFVTIVIQSPQAAELHIATDSEVETFLNEDLKNNWYGVYVTNEPNQKIGYLHEENKFEIDENGKKLFSNTVKFYGEYSNSGNLDSEEVVVNTFFESMPPYNFVRTIFTYKTSGAYVREETIIKNGMIDYRLDNNGTITQKKESNFDFRLNHMFGMESWLNKKSLQLNDQMLLRTISEGLVDDMKNILISINNTSVNGVVKKIFNIDIELFKKTDESDGLIVNSYWDNNKSLTWNLPLLGMWTTSKLETKEKAQDINYIADLFVLNSIQIDETSHNREKIYQEIDSQIEKRKKVIGMMYEIVGDYDESFAENTKYQNIQELNSDELNIHNLKIIYLGEHGFSINKKVEEEDVKKALEFKNKNSILSSLASKITKDAENEKEKIKMIREWTFNNIKYESELREVIDPLEILKNRKGDCTEITDLFNALLMSIGIPARAVTGYAGGIFFGGDDSFGAHQWSEVALAGEWIPVDATWNEFIENSLHHIKTNETNNEEYLYKKKYKLKLRGVQYDGAFKSFFHENGKITNG